MKDVGCVLIAAAIIMTAAMGFAVAWFLFDLVKFFINCYAHAGRC